MSWSSNIINSLRQTGAEFVSKPSMKPTFKAQPQTNSDPTNRELPPKFLANATEGDIYKDGKNHHFTFNMLM